MRRLGVLLTLPFVAAGCASEADGFPQGTPLEIVQRAPERTRADGPARLEVRRGRQADQIVSDLEDGAIAPLLDALDDATEVESFGGQQVMGVAAFRYDVTYLHRRSGRARLAVWIDSRGRVRRVEHRLDRPDQTPTQEYQQGDVETIDVLAFDAR